MDNIHKKIKSLRLEHGMTLKDLADRTGLSISFLSQIERGSSSLAITSLKKISDAFHINITYFFNDIENHNYVVRKEEMKKFKLEGTDKVYTRLAGKFPERKLEPIMVTIPANTSYVERYSHPGEEFYYVIEGSVVFRIEGQEYLLNPGDSIHFPSEQVHEWKNPANQETVLLSVLTPVIF